MRTLARALLLAAAVVCLFAINSFLEPHYDFNSFWGAGRALLEGRNPYDYDVIQEILYPRATANFNYPLYIAILVVPMGLFDLETAKNIWLTASEILLISSLYLIRRPLRGSGSVVLSTILCAAFVPTLIAFYDQQTSMFALFLLSVVYYGLQTGRHGLAGVALALALFKPQTVVLVVLVSLLRVRRRGLVAFGTTLAILLLIGFALMPDWPLQWWASASWLTREAGRAVPTVWGLSWHLFSQYWPGVVLSAGLLAAVALNTEFSFVLTSSLLLPVYMKPYDLVLLLIPASSRGSRKLLGALVLASYLLLIYVAVSGRGGDVFIVLTIITYAWLVYQDRAPMVRRIRHLRSLARLHLRA
jgi:hypothetical protein